MSFSMCCDGPSSSISTLPLVLRGEPIRPSFVACLSTNGLKPTPWTTPATWMLTRRVLSLNEALSGARGRWPR